MSPTGCPMTWAPWSANGWEGRTTPTPRWPRRPQLEALARELERTHPGAAGSLREGLEQTLTVLRLN